MLGNIAIALVLIFLAIKGCGYLLSRIPSVPTDYTQKVKTGGDLEATYLDMGPYETESVEYPAMMSFQKYELFYPRNIRDLEPLAAVVFVNGTGVKASKYPALQKHLASWGFITIATEEEHAWNGFSAEMCVRFLERLNTWEEDDKENVFLNKIDLSRLGITGHSQGGVGVINAITDQDHAPVYKAAAVLSATQTELADALMWQMDPTKIQTNVLMIASTGKTDAGIAPLNGMRQMFEQIPDHNFKVMMRRNDVDHGEMLYVADGYVTAWFMAFLQNDQKALKAFKKQDAELLQNPLYQDVVIIEPES